MHDKVQTTMSHGEWCEKTTASPPAHLFFISAIIHKLCPSVLPPPLFTSLGKGDTAERIKSNQGILGTLHQPYACFAATISPIIEWLTSLWFSFFTAITLISYHNAPGHVPCRRRWFLALAGAMRWSGRVRWNGEVLRKLSVTLAMCPRRQSKGRIALGSQLCWALCEPALSGAHYLYQFVLTIGTMVSSVLDKSLIINAQVLLLVCKYMH